jgi:hypothetical protein
LLLPQEDHCFGRLIGHLFQPPVIEEFELADSGTVMENVPVPPHGGCVVSGMLNLDTVRHPTCRCVIKHFVLSG